MAGAERIELPTAVLETVIIPFNYAPVSVTKVLYHKFNKKDIQFTKKELSI